MEGFDVTDFIKSFFASFTPQDVSLLVGLGIVAAFLHRSDVLTDKWAVLLPLGIGFGLGILQAAAAEPGRWGQGFYFGRGIVMGGGAGLVGWGVSVALDKLNIYPTKPKTPELPASTTKSGEGDT